MCYLSLTLIETRERQVSSSVLKPFWLWTKVPSELKLVLHSRTAVTQPKWTHTFPNDSLKQNSNKLTLQNWKRDEISVKQAKNNGKITKSKIFVPGLRVDFKVQNTKLTGNLKNMKRHQKKPAPRE